MRELTSESCSLEAVELCRLNALRLMRDAKNTGSPTRAALLELSVEECGKGLVVLFHFIKQKLAHLDKATRESLGEMRKAFDKFISEDSITQAEAFAPILEENFLRKTFQCHELKLSAVNEVVKMLSFVLSSFDISTLMNIFEQLKQLDPDFLKHLDASPRLKSWKSLEAELKQNLDEGRKVMEDLVKKLNNVDPQVLAEFDEIKKKGFFVDFNRDAGCFMFPRGLSEESCLSLEDLIHTLVNALDVLRFVPQMLDDASNINRSVGT